MTPIDLSKGGEGFVTHPHAGSDACLGGARVHAGGRKNKTIRADLSALIVRIGMERMD